MAYVYRNRNTGDVVAYPAPSARLDHLANWERIAEPEPVDQDAEPEEAGPVEDGADRPARSATKTAWVAYAVTRGMPETEAKAMTRDQLAARYRAPSAVLRPSGRG